MELKKKDIRALSKDQLRLFFKEIGDQEFRGNQVYEWLWNKGAHQFDDMSNISKDTRQVLKNHFVINHIEVDSLQKSKDGTIKNAVKLFDGLIVESVLIPTPNRTTACVSTQVGCSLDCKFCATAKLKKMRNLILTKFMIKLKLLIRKVDSIILDHFLILFLWEWESL